jgi:hypothetical protein
VILIQDNGFLSSDSLRECLDETGELRLQMRRGGGMDRKDDNSDVKRLNLLLVEKIAVKCNQH